MYYLGIALTVLAYRVYAAGKIDFTYGSNTVYYNSDEIDTNKLENYIVRTFIVSAFWIFVLPGYGIYKLGQRQKEKSITNK
jgi:hypothetical protein